MYTYLIEICPVHFCIRDERLQRKERRDEGGVRVECFRFDKLQEGVEVRVQLSVSVHDEGIEPGVSLADVIRVFIAFECGPCLEEGAAVCVLAEVAGAGGV